MSNFINTTGMNFPSGHLSNSQITQYMLCPMSYKFSYVDGLREPPNPALVAGKTAHKVLEIFAELENYEFS